MVSIKELRSVRIFDIALFDVASSYIFAIILIYFFWKLNKEHQPKQHYHANLFLRALLIFVIGYFVHMMLNVKTKIN